MAERKVIDLSNDGGVLKEILCEGIGDSTPSKGCNVSMHYIGRFLNGEQFDSSLDRNEPFEFDVGKGRVIKAFDMGVESMKLNEKCKITCNPKYAYGEAGAPPNIPSNATLVFEMDMLGWKNEDISPALDRSIERIILEPAAIKGIIPKEGSHVKVHLSGSYDGTVIEDREVEFTVGEGSDVGLIEGIEIALQKMIRGEKSKIFIKSKYAFGKNGNEALKVPPNATVEYVVHLIDCSKALEEWSLTDQERLKESKLFKEKGTKYFKKGNNELAIKMYNECIRILSEQIELDEVNDLKVMAYSNIALCHQKCGDNYEGKIACDKALQLNPSYIKALYRRGQCQLATGEFENALKDFQKVLGLEKSNKAASNQIEICKAKMREENQKERKLYANMFSKFAMGGDKEPVNVDEDVLSKCGEWNEEDGQRGADLAFERDNNIVMI